MNNVQLNKHQAAKVVGISRTTLDRHIREGKISAKKNESGRIVIDVSELERAYGTLDIHKTSSNVHTGQNETSSGNKPLDREIEQLHEKITLVESERERERRQFETVIDDLRRRLDQESEERRKLTMMLTDMRPKAPQKPVDGLRVRLGRWIAGNP